MHIRHKNRRIPATATLVQNPAKPPAKAACIAPIWRLKHDIISSISVTCTHPSLSLILAGTKTSSGRDEKSGTRSVTRDIFRDAKTGTRSVGNNGLGGMRACVLCEMFAGILSRNRREAAMEICVPTFTSHSDHMAAESVACDLFMCVCMCVYISSV